MGLCVGVGLLFFLGDGCLVGYYYTNNSTELLESGPSEKVSCNRYRRTPLQYGSKGTMTHLEVYSATVTYASTMRSQMGYNPS